MSARTAPRFPWVYLARPDEALLAAFRAGDEEALTALLHRHAARLLTLANAVLGDLEEAEEIGRRSFVALLRRPPAGTEPLRLTLLRDTWRRARRRRFLRHLAPWARLRPRRVLPLHALPSPRERAPCDTRLRGLAARERVTLALCDGLGLTYEEAAAVLRCRPRTVGLRLARARWRLVARRLGGGEVR